MAVSFPRLPRWLCGGNSKEKERSKGSSSSNSSVSTSSVKKSSSKSGSSVKKVKRGGWIGKGGEEEKMGNVVFPEPDDPEWSIGWVEPHGPGFKSEDGDDNDDNCGFVVLVPCYKKVLDGNQVPNVFFSTGPDGKNLEQLLSSLGKL